MTLRSNSRRNPFASTNTGNLNAAQDEQTAAPAKVESISQEQHEKVLAPDSEVPETPTLNTDSVEIESQGIPGRETSEAKEGNSFSDMSQSALDGSYSLEYNFDGHAPSDYDPTLGQRPWTSAQPRRRHSSSNRSVWSSSPVPRKSTPNRFSVKKPWFSKLKKACSRKNKILMLMSSELLSNPSSS